MRELGLFVAALLFALPAFAGGLIGQASIIDGDTIEIHVGDSLGAAPISDGQLMAVFGSKDETTSGRVARKNTLRRKVRAGLYATEA